MKLSKKEVRFDLFKPYFLEVNENGITTERLYNLEALFEHVASLALVESKRRVLGDIQMFHICNYDADNQVWEIQILHLREKTLPGIADDAGAYELIKLEDNQYPAESTTLMYDQRNHTLYMQRNIYGTSIKALEEYLQLLSPKGTLVALKPVISYAKIGRITTDRMYRKVVLVADSEMLSETDSQQTLGQLISHFSKYQGKIVRFDLGFGRQRHGCLNSHETASLIREAYGLNSVQRLEVKVSDDEDTPFETINLLDDRACYKIAIEYSRSQPITHSRLYRMCLGKYLEDNSI